MNKNTSWHSSIPEWLAPQQGGSGIQPASIIGTMSSTPTAETLVVRELLESHRGEFQMLLAKYSASNPRLFGSVARGTAHEGSDIDILVEMDPADGNVLLRASGLMEETRNLFNRNDIDIFPPQLLKEDISSTAIRDAVPF